MSLQLLQQYDDSSSEEDRDDVLMETDTAKQIKQNAECSFKALNKSQNMTDNERSTPGTSYNNKMNIGESNKDINNTNKEISEMVLKNNIINACKHGPTIEVLASIPTIDEDNINKNVIGENIMDFALKRRQDIEISQSESSDEESDDSTSDSDSDAISEWENQKEDEDSDTDIAKIIIENRKKTIIKVKGELAIEDLPPIEELTISVPEQECELVGTIYDIVDLLVIVQSLPNKPSLNLDTILFLENGSKPLGQIFDVFGKVSEPFYCVRFNTTDQIKDKGIASGMSVYYAPKTDHTNYVFISELMSLKGCDASWKGDIETPPQFLEFSDDEEEMKMKRMLKQQKKNANTKANPNAQTSNQSKQKRHKPTEFEEHMNMKNIMKTAECNRNSFNAQRQRFDRPFNPFSSGSRPNRDPPSAVNWASNSNVRFGGSPLRYVGRGNWNWSSQTTSTRPNYSSPPFMRPPRFAVTPPEWPRQPFRLPSSIPPPGGTSNAAWFMLPPPSPPPDT